MRIRIKFRKFGAMKFIGHLDMMRYFQKCMRRAEIDIAYSEGFSPHQIMSFAAPLGVGVTSDGEYLDIEACSTLSSEESLRALNEVMAEGVEVVSYRRLKDTDQKAMASVAAADYEIRIKEGYDAPKADYADALERFFEQPKEVLICKKTKKGEKTMDLKKLVYDFRIAMEQDRPVFYMKVCAGSVDNLKPELALSALYEFMGQTFNPFSVQIHRIDVYSDTEGRLTSLGEIGETIE